VQLKNLTSTIYVAIRVTSLVYHCAFHTQWRLPRGWHRSNNPTEEY